MHLGVLFMLALLPTGSPDLFSVCSALQGLYDELSESPPPQSADAAAYHAVLYTPDWAYVDQDGRRYSWPEFQQKQLQDPQVDETSQYVQAVSLTSDGALAMIKRVTVRTVADTEGRYGPKGRTHALSELTTFRDTWARTGETWRFKTREQVGSPRESIDAPIPMMMQMTCASSS
jgi:hypothetical protein